MKLEHDHQVPEYAGSVNLSHLPSWRPHPGTKVVWPPWVFTCSSLSITELLTIAPMLMRLYSDLAVNPSWQKLAYYPPYWPISYDKGHQREVSSNTCESIYPDTTPSPLSLLYRVPYPVLNWVGALENLKITWQTFTRGWVVETRLIPRPIVQKLLILKDKLPCRNCVYDF